MRLANWKPEIATCKPLLFPFKTLDQVTCR